MHIKINQKDQQVEEMEGKFQEEVSQINLVVAAKDTIMAAKDEANKQLAGRLEKMEM